MLQKIVGLVVEKENTDEINFENKLKSLGYKYYCKRDKIEPIPEGCFFESTKYIQYYFVLVSNIDEFEKHFSMGREDGRLLAFLCK